MEKSTTGNIIRQVVRWFLRITVLLFVFSLSLVILYRFVNPPVTPLMVIRTFEQLFDEDRSVRIEKEWVDVEEVSQKMVRAIITSEDQNFMTHNGFDFKAIEKAMKYNERHQGRKTRGASTVSQQTAKNVFLWPGRSWFRKGLEVYFTFMIETFWSKKRIMEVYLNVVELGDGIYGVEAASQKYYRIPALRLSSEQSAMLTVCLPSPLRYNPVKPSGYLKRRQQWVIRHMRYRGYPDFDGVKKN